MTRHVLLAVSLAVAWDGMLTAQPAAELPAALAAKKRQEAIQSLDLRFHLKETIEPGALTPLTIDETKWFPLKPLVIESDNRLLIDGENVRVEWNHPTANPGTTDLPPLKRVTVVNGDVAQEYSILTDRPATTANSRGSIRAYRQHESILAELSFEPLVLSCRGWNSRLGLKSFAAGKWHSDGEPVVIDGVLLQPLKYVSVEYGQGGEMLAWADPNVDHAIRRVHLKAEGGMSYLVTAAFSPELPTGRLLPRSWSSTQYGSDGRVRRSREYTVSSVTVNQAPPEAEFELAFPPNMEIENRYDGRTYLLREDGSWQVVRDANPVAPVVQPEAALDWWARRQPLFVPLGVGLLLLGMLIASRWRRGGTPAPSN